MKHLPFLIGSALLLAPMAALKFATTIFPAPTFWLARAGVPSA